MFGGGEGGTELWHVDLAAGLFRPLRTSGPLNARGTAAWAPAGDEVAVGRRSAPGRYELVALAVADPGGERVLDRGPLWMGPSAWSADGHTIVYSRGADLWMVAADGRSPARPVLATPAYEILPALSPDGRWLSFTSDESGRFEVWVARFPDMRGKRQLSLGGGESGSEWVEGGRAIYYFDGSLHARRIPVEERDGRTSFGVPTVILGGRIAADILGADFTADGQRLLTTLMRSEGGTAVRLVVDWPQLLER